MVCLGNICRSPVAEGIMRKKINEAGLNITVDSAGTIDFHAGQYPDSRSIKNALKNGVDVSRLISRQFSTSDFDEFDIIYVMDKSNYSNVKSIARNENDMKKIKLLLSIFQNKKNMEVPDPYSGDEDGFEKTFQLINSACQLIVNELKINTNAAT